MQLKVTQILTVLLRYVLLTALATPDTDPTLYSSEKSPLQSQQLQPFLNTLAQFVANNSTNKRDVAVQCLEAVLPRAECRRAIWANASLVGGCVRLAGRDSKGDANSLAFGRLVDILKHNASPQMSYQVGFCFWLLTFEQEVAEQIQKYVQMFSIMRVEVTGLPSGASISYHSSSMLPKEPRRRRSFESLWQPSEYVQKLLFCRSLHFNRRTRTLSRRHHPPTYRPCSSHSSYLSQRISLGGNGQTKISWKTSSIYGRSSVPASRV